MLPRVHTITALLLAAALATCAAAQPDTTQGTVAPPDSATDILTSALTDEEKISALNRMILLNPRNPELYNNLGVIYAEREEWTPARDAFIAAVQCDPRQPEAHRNLGMVMSEMGMYDLAVSEFEAYQKFSDDGGRDAWLMIGDTRHDAGDVPAALAAYESGLQAYGGAYGPGSAELVIARALLLEGSGDIEGYEALLRRWSGPASDYLGGGEPADRAGRASQAILTRMLQIHVDDAALMTESGLHAQAAAAYEAAMVLAPDNQELLPLAAMAWFDAGESMKAKVLARRATEESPDSPGGWKARGRIAEAEKRPRDAIEAYRKAFELDETQTDVAARVGQIYLSLGDNVNARKFMGAVASDPDTAPEILYNYGLSLQRDGAHELALRPLRKVVERQPGMGAAWRALATSLRQTKRYAEAARAYGQAFILDSDARLAFQQGYCLQHCERPLEAAVAYEKAMELDPADTKARYNHGLSLMAAGEYGDALASFQALDAMEPDSYRVLFNTGVCHQNLQQHDEALLAYETALDIDETSAVWNNMGLVYDAMGAKDDAKECYEEGKRLKSEGK